MQINKFIVHLLAISAVLAACNNRANNQAQEDLKGGAVADSSASLPADAAVITLKDSDTYQFGTIKDGDKVSHEFVFTNTGKSPLIISNVQATCGCTTPEYTKTPIKPGGEGTIKVIYNSSGQGTGPKHKTVTVTSNAIKKLMVLNLKGTVK